MSGIIFEHTLPQLLDGTKTETTRRWHDKLLVERQRPFRKKVFREKYIESLKGRTLFEIGKSYAVKEHRNAQGLWMDVEKNIRFTPVKSDMLDWYGKEWKGALRDRRFLPVRILVEDLYGTNVIERSFFTDCIYAEGFRQSYEFLAVWVKMHDPEIYRNLALAGAFEAGGELVEALNYRYDTFPNRYTGFVIRFSLLME